MGIKGIKVTECGQRGCWCVGVSAGIFTSSQPPSGCTQNSPKKRKCPTKVRDQRSEWPHWFGASRKATGSQISTGSNQSLQDSITETDPTLDRSFSVILMLLYEAILSFFVQLLGTFSHLTTTYCIYLPTYSLDTVCTGQ